MWFQYFTENTINYCQKLNSIKYILILGNKEVGKTVLISKYLNKDIPKEYAHTIGAEFEWKILEKGKKKYKIGLIGLVPGIYDKFKLNYDAIMLIYDIYNKESFESIVEVFKLIENNWKIYPMILLGNKKDGIANEKMNNQIKKEEVEDFAKRKEIKLLEINAKEGTNIDQALEYLVNKILEKRQIGKSETEELSKEENEEKEVKEDDNEVKFDLCCF